MSHFRNPDYCRQVREATEKTIRLAHHRGSASVVRQPAQDVIDDCNLMLGALEEIERLRTALLKQAELMQQEAEDARGDGRPGDGQCFDMCAADCRDAVGKESEASNVK